ncbi:MAG: hypothetical protein Q8R15_02600 [Candidatus Micrarchaeota archaeon]|nr:hypothetical protein [Candidatus Micrarchaeota archaeon]
MSFLTRGNLIKAFAALLIVGFVVELFIVYTYSPSQSPVDSSAEGSSTPVLVREQFVSASPASFVVNSFTDIMKFQCNVSRLPAFPGLLGSPIAIGVSGNATLFFARANGTIPNAVFLSEFKSGLIPFCGSEVVVYREALVSFNGSSVPVVSELNGLNKSTLTKRQLEGYGDRFGRGALALVSDANAIPGSVVELLLGVVLEGSGASSVIVPDSLRLEQPAVVSDSGQNVIELELVGVVDSFSGGQVAVLQVPWENRSVKPVFFNGAVINEELSVRDEIIIVNAASGSINESALMAAAPFIVSLENRSGGLVLDVGNFTSREVALQALNGLNASIVFPFSRYLVQFNSTLWQRVEILFDSVFLKEAILTPVNLTANSTASGGFVLPVTFDALVFSNVSIGDRVVIVGPALVEGGKLVQFLAKQRGVDSVLSMS